MAVELLGALLNPIHPPKSASELHPVAPIAHPASRQAPRQPMNQHPR